MRWPSLVIFVLAFQQICIPANTLDYINKDVFCYLGNAYKPQSLKLGSQPRGMDVFKEQKIIVTASINEITVSEDNRKLSTLKVHYEPTSVSCSPRKHVAIGGNVDNKV